MESFKPKQEDNNKSEQITTTRAEALVTAQQKISEMFTEKMEGVLKRIGENPHFTAVENTTYTNG